MALGAALNAAPSVGGPSGVVAMCNAGEEGSAMSKAAVGLVGWRGMVGSVLMERMRAESDFRDIEPLFFSTSNAGGQAPDIGRSLPPLADAHDLDALMGRSEEHTSELQSRGHLVCRLLLEYIK